MRTESLTMYALPLRTQAEQGTPTDAPGWAPSAVWLLLQRNARASRKTWA
jgi:hypothetical protein